MKLILVLSAYISIPTMAALLLWLWLVHIEKKSIKILAIIVSSTLAIMSILIWYSIRLNYILLIGLIGSIIAGVNTLLLPQKYPALDDWFRGKHL